MDHPDAIKFHKILFLCNNMTETLLLKDRTNSQHNYALVVVMTLRILYYAQSKCSIIVQRVNTQFAFANNVCK